MFKLLDRIRQKPEPTRQLIAVTASLLIVLIILIVWFYAGPPFFPENSVSDDDIQSAPSNPLEDIRNIGEGFLDSLEGVKQNINDLPSFGGDKEAAIGEPSGENVLEKQGENDRIDPYGGEGITP